MAQVRMPDGTVVEMPDNPDPALLARLQKFQDSQRPPGETALNSTIPLPQGVAPDTGIPDSGQTAMGDFADQAKALGGDVLTAIQGAPETAATMLNNSLVQAGAGLSAPFVADNPDDAASYIRDFTQQHSYAPQGESAQKLIGALSEALNLEPAKRALGETTLEATGSPLAATVADILPDLGAAFLPATKGAGAIERGVEALAPKAAEPLSPIVEQLRNADIQMRPSDIRGMHPDKSKVKVPGEFRERFANAPNLKKDQTLHNQARFTEMAAKKIGAPDLTEASIAKAKEPHAATYDLAESVLNDKPTPPGLEKVLREALDATKLERPRGQVPTVTGTIGALRRRANKRINTDNPDTQAAGYADRNMADALEEEFGKALESAGEPQLFKQYQDARKGFAQIHDVETATHGGQIDAHKLKQLGQKVKLSGELKLIADAAAHVPNVTKHSTTTAARAGGEIESSREGIIKAGAKGLVRSLGIPGTDLTMNVGSGKFQRSLGKPNEARTSYYGETPPENVPRTPEQQDLDLAEALQLQQPPGAVGTPPRSPRPLGPQADAFGPGFEFSMAPGEVGVPPPAQLSLQDVLGLGEPLAMKQAPGRVGKPRRNP